MLLSGRLLQVSMAGDMATWLVAHSQMHPAFSDSGVMYDMSMGGFEDPTTRNTAGRFEQLILELQTAAYDQAKRLIRQRRAAIEQLANELTSDSQETVQGRRIVEVIETSTVAEPELLPSNGVWSENQLPLEQPEVSGSEGHHAYSCRNDLDICMLCTASVVCCSLYTCRLTLLSCSK